MDVVSAEAQLNTLVEKRAGARSSADEAADAWKASEIRHDAKLRERNRQAWQDYFLRLAASLRASADLYDRRAEALRERGGG